MTRSWTVIYDRGSWRATVAQDSCGNGLSRGEIVGRLAEAWDAATAPLTTEAEGNAAHV